MMNRLYALLLIFASLVSCIKEGTGQQELVAGDHLPDFVVTMSDGAQVSGKQLSSGVSCVVFFTTACPDCRNTLPHLQRLYEEYASCGVKFALISREEGAESIAAYWDSEAFTMPYSAQDDRIVYELFAKTRVPRVYICKEGIIKAIFTDQPQTPTFDDMRTALESTF